MASNIQMSDHDHDQDQLRSDHDKQQQQQENEMQFYGHQWTTGSDEHDQDMGSDGQETHGMIGGIKIKQEAGVNQIHHGQSICMHDHHECVSVDHVSNSSVNTNHNHNHNRNRDCNAKNDSHSSSNNNQGKSRTDGEKLTSFNLINCSIHLVSFTLILFNFESCWIKIN